MEACFHHEKIKNKNIDNIKLIARFLSYNSDVFFSQIWCNKHKLSVARHKPAILRYKLAIARKKVSFEKVAITIPRSVMKENVNLWEKSQNFRFKLNYEIMNLEL